VDAVLTVLEFRLRLSPLELHEIERHAVGVAEVLDLCAAVLGRFLEVIVLQSLEGAPGFSKGTLRRIEDLKKIYEMDYDLREANRMIFSGKRPS